MNSLREAYFLVSGEVFDSKVLRIEQALVEKKSLGVLFENPDLNAEDDSVRQRIRRKVI